MLKNARGDICKPHIFRPRTLSHEQSIDDFNFKALENSLDKIKSKAIRLEKGWFLGYPQTGDELRKIKQYCEAKTLDKFPSSDYFQDQYQWHASLCNSMEAYRDTGKEWPDWMTHTFEAAKSFELQAAHKIADVYQFAATFAATEFQLEPLWVVWDEETNEIGSFLEDYGIPVADAPHIVPLEKYGLFEGWVKKNRRAELEKLFSGKVYNAFDEDSPLVRFQGYYQSLHIVLDAYKKESDHWGELDDILKSRTEELKAAASRAKI